MQTRSLLHLVTGTCVAIVGVGAIAYAASVRTVEINDQCDAATFNAVLGPGACTNTAGVPFDVFINQVTTTGKAGPWHFAPGIVQLRDGEELQARNTGGETHTFTEVDHFGGGFVDLLNQLSGNPVAVPECNPATNPDIQFVAPGQTTKPDSEEPGIHHYQCCIHPWMRTDIVVR